MRAWQVPALGEPSTVLRLAELDVPEPARGQVTVRVLAAAANFPDVLMCRGQYQERPELPFTPGVELCGEVSAVGEGVQGVSVGDRVMGMPVRQHGSFAEYSVLPGDLVFPAPPELDAAEASAFCIAYQTGWFALHKRTTLRPGETLLVHAAAGGVGTVAVQLARRLGARVIGTASERNHAYLRSLGAEPVGYGPGLVERVRALAPDGVDVVLDAVGGEAVDASLELVADRARIGTTVDQKAADEHGIVRLRGARSVELLAELAGLAAGGELVLPLAAVHPLTAAAEAHREVETGHVRGKVVLTTG